MYHIGGMEPRNCAALPGMLVSNMVRCAAMMKAIVPGSVSYEEALFKVLSRAARLETEEVPLTQALGRIPARDYTSPVDIPPVRIAAMDGYAFPDDGTHQGGYGLIQTGAEHSQAPQGCAARVLTGHPLPAWANAVAAEEHCEVAGLTVKPDGVYPAGTNVRPAGEDSMRGDMLHRCGCRIDPIALCRLASGGITHIEAVRKPRVAILTSGNELIPPGSPLSSGVPRYECDSALLAGFLAETAAEPVFLPHQVDDENIIRNAIEQLEGFDMLITCGGAANSEADHIRPVLSSLTAEFFFERVRMKPARPTGFAVWRGKPVFCLPGNPVAVFVAFHVLVRPLLLRMTGSAPDFGLSIPLRLGTDFEADQKRRLFVRSIVKQVDGVPTAFPHSETGSGLIRTLSESDALIPVPPGMTLPAGSSVKPAWIRTPVPYHG